MTVMCVDHTPITQLKFCGHLTNGVIGAQILEELHDCINQATTTTQEERQNDRQGI